MYIYIQWEVIETRENLLVRLNLSSLNNLCFPAPSSALKSYSRFTLPFASQDLPTWDINHAAWAPSLQGNIAKGDSEQIFYLQRNSSAHLLPLSLSLPQSSRKRPWVEAGVSGSSYCCCLTEGPRGLVLRVCVKALSGVMD